MAKNNRNKRQLSAKQRLAIDALVAGADYGTASLKSGVSERTLFRWRGEADFASELSRLSGIALTDAAVRMKGNMGTAVGVLVDVMTDATAPPSARIRAALGMLDTGLRIVEAGELLARLEALEVQNAKS